MMARTTLWLGLIVLMVIPLYSFALGSEDLVRNVPSTYAYSVTAPYGISDLGFVEDRGQWPNGPMFVATNGFGSIGASTSSIFLDIKGNASGSTGDVMMFRFPGSDPCDPHGTVEIETEINFIRGDAATWTVTKGYEHLVYYDLWPGVDMVISLRDGCPKYEFVLDPGADPSIISISVEGAVSITEVSGEIVIGLPSGGVLIDAAPQAYDVGGCGTVDVRYRMIDERSYGFTVSGHDRSRTLVIDPVIYSTFMGGGGWDQGKNVVIDDDGKAYICGHTDSMDLPTTPGSYDESDNGDIDGYVARLSSDGSALEWCTFFGGSSDDYCHEVALRGSDGLVICGHSSSADLPVTSDAFDGSYAGMLDAYVAVLSRDGSSLKYSTYIGGQENDYAYSIGIDHMGIITVAGATYSSDIPTTEEAYQRALAGDADCLILSFDVDMSIRYITYLGGTEEDRAYDISVDEKGRSWIGGTSYSSDYPTTEGAFDRSFNGGADAVLTALDMDGSVLIASSYYGSTGMEGSNTIAISRSGTVAIAGRTTSSALTMAGNAYDTSFNGGADGFIAGFGEDVSDVLFSTYIGGSGVDDVAGIAIDGAGDLCIAGYSSSVDFPTTNDAVSVSHLGGFYDETIAVLDGDELLYSTFLGGTSDFDHLYDISVDDAGRLYAVGNTASGDHFTTAGAYDTMNDGNEDIVVVSMDLGLPHPPTPPSDLMANIDDGFVELVWDVPIDMGSSGSVRYEVYRGTGPYDLVPIDDDVQQTSYEDRDITPGGTYYYAVKALNDVGRSRASNVVEAIFVVVPSPPRDIAALGGPHHVLLSWSAPLSDGGAPLLGYDILRRGGEDEATSIASLDPSTLEYNDTSVIQGKEYNYAVVAFNIRGPSPPSVEASVIPMDRPDPPTDLNASAGDGYVLLRWGPPVNDGGSPIIAYEVWRNDSAGEVATISLGHTEHEYNDTGLTNGMIYTYYVTARNLAGRSLRSNEQSMVPAALPDPPSDLRARSGNGYVHLEWRAPEDDGGFDILEFRIIRSHEGSETSEIGSVPGHDGSFNDTKVDNGHGYRYWISAETMIGPSPFAGPVEAIPIGPPDAPGDVRSTRGDGYVSITWLPPAKDGGSPVVQYSILRGISKGSMRAIATVGNDTLLYNDTSVRNGVTYHYAVRAINPFFGSEISGSIWTVPMGRPDPPTDLKAEMVSGMVRLTWNPPAETKGSAIESYRVHKRIGVDLEVIDLGAGVLSYLDANATGSGSVFYSLTCRNAMGDSRPSEQVMVDVAVSPGKVQSLKATVSEGKVKLTWDRPEGDAVSHFKIYRRTEGRGTVLVGTVDEQETSFIDVSPVIGRSSYYVIAMNERGLGEPSEEVDVTVKGEADERDSGPLLLAISISLLLISLGIFSSVILIKRRRKKG